MPKIIESGKTLDLSNNMITEIPEEILEIKNIKIKLHNNPIKKLPENYGEEHVKTLELFYGHNLSGRPFTLEDVRRKRGWNKVRRDKI